MFMVINKDKIVSYLISLSTVAMLFIFSFMISKKNDEIIRTSSNAIKDNNCQQTNTMNEYNYQQVNTIGKNNTNNENMDANFD